MTAVLLALLTALCYGLANYLGPVLTRAHPLGAVLLVGQVVGVVGAGALVLVTGDPHPGREALLYGAAAGACNGLALATLYTAAAAGPLSIVLPVSATGSVVPVALALLTGERPSALQLLGIPLAVVGVVLAAARDAGAPQQASSRTILLSLTSAAAFGGFLALYGHASEEGTPWAAFSSRTSLVVCTVAVLLARSRSIRVPVAVVPSLTLPGLLLLVGTVSYGEATTQGLVSVVAVLATLAPVVTVSLAVVLLGERLARRQQAGVATALLGVVLLAAG